MTTILFAEYYDEQEKDFVLSGACDTQVTDGKIKVISRQPKIFFDKTQMFSIASAGSVGHANLILSSVNKIFSGEKCSLTEIEDFLLSKKGKKLSRAQQRAKILQLASKYVVEFLQKHFADKKLARDNNGVLVGGDYLLGIGTHCFYIDPYYGISSNIDNYAVLGSGKDIARGAYLAARKCSCTVLESLRIAIEMACHCTTVTDYPVHLFKKVGIEGKVTVQSIGLDGKLLSEAVFDDLNILHFCE